eukprot:9364010-Pyramimonas_sp.AAC.1
MFDVSLLQHERIVRVHGLLDESAGFDSPLADVPDEHLPSRPLGNFAALTWPPSGGGRRCSRRCSRG